MLVYTSQLEYSKMSPEQKKIVSWYGNKTDSRMIYQQNLSARMFVSYKLYDSSSIYKVIRPVLNFLFFFYDKISQVQKKHNQYIGFFSR